MSVLTVIMQKPDLFVVWIGTQRGQAHGFCIGGGNTERDACLAAIAELKARMKELKQRTTLLGDRR